MAHHTVIGENNWPSVHNFIAAVIYLKILSKFVVFY